MSFLIVNTSIYFILIYLLNNLYRLVARLAEKRKINLGRFFVSKLDLAIPAKASYLLATSYFSSFLVIPIILIFLWLTNLANYQFLKSFLGYFYLLTSSYVFYLVFPNNVCPFLKGPLEQGDNLNFLDRKILKLLGKEIHPFNSFPSYHISSGFLLVLVAYDFASPVLFSILTSWFVYMSISTLTLKWHTILDFLGGIVFASLSYLLAQNQTIYDLFLDYSTSSQAIAINLVVLATAILIGLLIILNKSKNK